MVRPLLSAVLGVVVEVVEAEMEVWLLDSRSCRSRKRIVFIALDDVQVESVFGILLCAPNG